MANEINVAVKLTAKKAGAEINISKTKTITMAGDQMLSNVQIVGTSVEALALNEVSTIGWTLIHNMDTTNYVEIGVDAAGTENFAKLLAGEFMLFPAATTALYGKANTASCNVFICAVEL